MVSHMHDYYTDHSCPKARIWNMWKHSVNKMFLNTGSCVTVSITERVRYSLVDALSEAKGGDTIKLCNLNSGKDLVIKVIADNYV